MTTADLHLSPAQEFGRFVNMQIVASDDHPTVPGAIVLTLRVIGRPNSMRRYVTVIGYGRAVQLQEVREGSVVLKQIEAAKRGRDEGRVA